MSAIITAVRIQWRHLIKTFRMQCVNTAYYLCSVCESCLFSMQHGSFNCPFRLSLNVSISICFIDIACNETSIYVYRYIY